ncbi:MAG: ATPase [Bacteroides sp.]|nr:ATPase [Bacteroides sp.]MCM1378781.1 ATPase [Bacteroides sp.]MCM1445398.1 ATPase [Prevotella sp.]
MIIIADAGSTKVEWCAANSAADCRTFVTPGINATQMSEEELRRRFVEALGGLTPDAIYYYGAGCATPEICTKVVGAMPSGAAVEVASDMLGAARALYGRESGLALILGTGSNSALYDGHSLTLNMPPLGFILGDEGGGASLGKRLLNTAYRTGLLRPELERFLEMGYGEILERVYRRPEANKFLASLVPFIAEHSERLSAVIDAEFDALFDAMSPYYYHYRKLRAVGGVAKTFEPQLRARAALHGFTIDQIQDRPMMGLISYHLNER